MAADMMGGGAGPPASGGGMNMSSMMNSAKRRQIRRMFQQGQVKHGLVHSPMITHSQNGSGTSPPKFGVGGGFKAGGF